MKKKKILILAGGYSKERKISILTAKSVYKQLKKFGIYQLKIIEPKGNLIKNLDKYKPDVVFNALHGRYGEDGFIQSILEIKKIKYTHSGVLSSSLAIDKYLSKQLYKTKNIRSPKYIYFNFQNNLNKKKLVKLVENKLKFPVVIKPINEGSSVNVYICQKNNFLKNLKKLKEYNEIIIEKYIPGREIQVAIMGQKKLGAIELKPKRKFYDYEAKYNPKSNTRHIIPVKLTKKKYQEVTSIALKAHNVLNCKGITRSDFRFYKNKFYLLETNTQPGMTSLSLVPEIAKFNKINFLELIKWMINNASINR